MVPTPPTSTQVKADSPSSSCTVKLKSNLASSRATITPGSWMKGGSFKSVMVMSNVTSSCLPLESRTTKVTVCFPTSAWVGVRTMRPVSGSMSNNAVSSSKDTVSPYRMSGS